MTHLAAVWQARTHGAFQVAPDGCRDLILRLVPGQAPQWQVSDLDPEVSRGFAPAGTEYYGWRMRPGVAIDTDGLLRRLARGDDPSGAGVFLAEHTRLQPALDEALLALACARDVSGAARQAGLGLRSFQRCVMQGTGFPPVWWLRLARARRAARAVRGGALAQLAYDTGFADQAHLSREFRRFFGVTPGQMRDGLGPAIAPGYGA